MEGPVERKNREGHMIQKRNVNMAIVLCATWLTNSCAATNLKSDAEFGPNDQNGLIAVGITSRVSPDQRLELVITKFNPETLRADDSTLSPGRLINVRVAPTEEEVQYSIVKVKPGLYAISAVNFMPGGYPKKTRQTHLCESVYFDVKPGKVTYIGDHQVEPGPPSSVSSLGASEEDASWYVSTLPNVTAELVVAPLTSTKLISKPLFQKEKNCD